MNTKDKLPKEKLEELKDRKIDEETLQDVAGGGGIWEPLPDSKPNGGGLFDAPKPKVPKPKNK